jgi:hypothetical protein
VVAAVLLFGAIGIVAIGPSPRLRPLNIGSGETP